MALGACDNSHFTIYCRIFSVIPFLMTLAVSYSYAYAVGCLFLLASWLLVFLWRKDLRREMVWATIIGLPFGFIDYLLVPNYWHPSSLFGLMEKYGVGLESFVFMGLMSGLSSVFYEFTTGVHAPYGRPSRVHHFGPVLLSLTSFLVFSALFPWRVIYVFMTSGFIGAISLGLLRPDLWGVMLWGGCIFAIFYTAVFLLVNVLFPGLVSVVYSVDDLWGIYVVGVPLEEIAVGFFVGGFWGAVYQYIKGLRYSYKK